MSFIPFNNTVQLESVYRWEGQIVENVFNYQTNTVPTAGNMDALAAVWRGLWELYIRPLQSSAVQLQSIKVTSLHAQNGPAIEYTTGLPLSGQGTSAAVPNNVAVVVKWITANRGRSYRGRTYHLGIPQGSVTGSVLTTGYRTSLVQAYSNFVLLGTTPTWTLSVASRYSNGQPRTNGVITPINALSINPTVDSQRRRLPERGA